MTKRLSVPMVTSSGQPETNEPQPQTEVTADCFLFNGDNLLFSIPLMRVLTLLCLVKAECFRSS